jgi:hypothetical protein
MALHNFIRDHDLDDSDFQLDVQDDSDPRSCPGEGTVLHDAIAAAMAVWVTFVPATLVTKFLLLMRLFQVMRLNNKVTKILLVIL